MRQTAWLAVSLLAVFSSAGPQNRYVDANQPGMTARLFAAGIVSRSREEGAYAERPVFAPDFSECYFDVNNYKTRIFTSFVLRYRDGKWTAPEPAFFTRNGGHQASLSGDGSRLFFTAPSPSDPKVDGIWMAQRVRDAWGEPAFLDPPVNTGSDTRFPCVTASGTLYYLCATKDGQASRSGVCRARLAGSRYEAVEKIAGLQSSADVRIGDFYVSADEKYLIVYTTLPDNLGQGDLYVSFRRPDNTWTAPRNLGPAVNTKGYDFAPSITPDGRYLFFTRDRGDKQGDVYWISSKIIEDLKPGM